MTSDMFENLSPEQLRIALVAAYEAIAGYEAEVGGLRTAMALLWDEGERHELEGQTDFLTGALNRKGAEAALTEELAYSGRFRSPLSVIAIDVDDFKEINDRYGHPAGDDALKEIVRRIRATIRPYDKTGRMGGDELIVFLRRTTLENATLVAERLRKAVAAKPILSGESTLPVTISIGVTEVKTRDDLKAADEALYEAKRGGRNRVVTNKR
ncbi:MAG: GGDEF domain-containing protein [Patescibacteria group bacterium]